MNEIAAPRRDVLAELRENEERLRLVQAAGGVGSFDWNVLTGEIHRSPEYLALQGLPAESPPHGRYSDRWLDRVHPEDRDRVWANFQEDLARGGHFEREYRIVRPDNGETRWILNKGRVDKDANGRAVRLLSAQTDITARKADEARLQLLVHELNHRVKNTLATVQSLAAQTLRNAASTGQAREDLEARLMALSRAHDILTRRTWTGADLTEVVSGAIQPFGQGRVRAEGPAVALPAQAAVSIAMALHELGTNAVKYGALSVPEGRVEIAWSYEDGRLELAWRERDGPPVAPPTRRGFGARLIEEGLLRELAGEAVIDFAPQGVCCRISAWP